MTNNAHDRMILAVDSGGLPSMLATDGFHPSDNASILSALRGAGFWLGPRSILETREDFRQIIPYIVLCDGRRFVCYERTPAGGEARLHGKLSIGLGGHIDFSDVARVGDCVDLEATIALSAQRELEEELGLEQDHELCWQGLIIESDTPVSRVHIGMVASARLDATTVSGAEAAIDNVRLLTPSELRAEASRLEGWSQRLLPYLDRFTGQANPVRAVA